MKKLLVGLALCALALLAVGIALSFFIGSIAKKGVNTLAPRITGTTVTLDSAQISPWNGTGTLKGLYIGNPKGWTSEKLAYLGMVHIDLVPTSLMSDTIVIEKVVIEKPEFVYETKIISSNVSELMKQVEKNLGTAPAPDPKSKNKTPDPGKKYSIKHLSLKDAKVTIGVGVNSVTVPMENFEVNDLGTPEEGLTVNQLVFAVGKQVTAKIVVAAVGSLKTVGTTSGAAASEGVKKIGESIKGLFGGEEKPKPQP
ncbi:MAG: AsmA family protein [Opitutaceae bacterium]